jgi:L-amino acid N-acyltransferase YncA
VVRAAERGDAAAVARIYNRGIEERQATFETEPREVAEVLRWLEERWRFPLLVAEVAGGVCGWARVSSYSIRRAYSGVGECQVYVDPDVRRHGVGTALTEALCAESERLGYWKLIGRLFPENEPSVALVRRCGFREVGVHLRHGRLDGRWRDVLLVERLLGPANLRGASRPAS